MPQAKLVQDWSDMGHYSAPCSTDLDTAIDDTRRANRAIRSQVSRSWNDGLSRKAPLTTDNGKRFLVVNAHTNRAYFQSDDVGDALQYALDHPGSKLMDLDEAGSGYYRERMIGQFLGLPDKQKTYSPRLDPTTGRFGMVTETLLKDRKPTAAKIEVTNTTPVRVLIERILANEQVVRNGAKLCSNCGMALNRSCKCNGKAAKQLFVADENWLQAATEARITHKESSYCGYVRYGMYRLCPLASSWIGESI